VLFYFAREAAGAARIRLSLRPLYFEGNIRANLGRITPRDRGFTLAVIASEAKQSMGPQSKLDCFVASLLAMTA
jgi:hypothetical protein